MVQYLASVDSIPSTSILGLMPANIHYQYRYPCTTSHNGNYSLSLDSF